MMGRPWAKHHCSSSTTWTFSSPIPQSMRPEMILSVTAMPTRTAV